MKLTVLLICFAATAGLFAAAQSNSDEPRKDATPSKPDASDKFIGKVAGQVRDDNGMKMMFIWCPPGFVTMEIVEFIAERAAEKFDEQNSDDDDVVDEPAPKLRQTEQTTPVKVLLTQGYWLGKYEVTSAQQVETLLAPVSTGSVVDFTVAVMRRLRGQAIRQLQTVTLTAR